MGTTADKINYLNDTKAAIKEAIKNKGVTVSDSDTFRSYAEKIGTIETGGDGPFVSSSEDIPIYEDNIIVLPRFAEKGEGFSDPPIKNAFWYGLKKLDTSTYPSGVQWNPNNESIEGKGSAFWTFGLGEGSVEEDDPAPFLEEIILKNVKLTGNPVNTFRSDYSATNYHLKKIKFIDCDTSEITSMLQNFRYCAEVEELILENFNTSNVTNMKSTFDYCETLTSLDLSSFNTSNVTNMTYMFRGCIKLSSLDLSTFDTSNVTSNYNLFEGCSRLTTVSWGNNWMSNSAITSLEVNNSPLSHESCLDLFNKLATRDNSPTLTLSSTTKGYMSEEEIAIATNKGWTVA